MITGIIDFWRDFEILGGEKKPALRTHALQQLWDAQGQKKSQKILEG
jgi:hypothetical protein